MAAPTSDSATLARIREYNLQNAELAAAGRREILVQLLVDGAATEDPDLRRKIYETLGKTATEQDPKQPISISAPLSFQIILDDTPQVAPPRRARAITRQETSEIEDVVELPQIAATGPSLDSLAATLSMAEDE